MCLCICIFWSVFMSFMKDKGKICIYDHYEGNKIEIFGMLWCFLFDVLMGLVVDSTLRALVKGDVGFGSTSVSVSAGVGARARLAVCRVCSVVLGWCRDDRSHSVGTRWDGWMSDEYTPSATGDVCLCENITCRGGAECRDGPSRVLLTTLADRSRRECSYRCCCEPPSPTRGSVSATDAS